MSEKLNLIFQDRTQMQVKTLEHGLAHDMISINISLFLLNEFLLHLLWSISSHWAKLLWSFLGSFILP